ncbi:hypothetical protein P8C59_003799 [Phyllachora maydis]|uniref:Uncharacterized protein n=1 Tax=Phyllachora maydis TaxID=1825666 RepID=A0AAD9MAP3_9PEZI|nr:hypothetical protein P8C59_003799 [Phyllachora maydis]
MLLSTSMKDLAPTRAPAPSIKAKEQARLGYYHLGGPYQDQFRAFPHDPAERTGARRLQLGGACRVPTRGVTRDGVMALPTPTSLYE